jgi:hypothetical protein
LRCQNVASPPDRVLAARLRAVPPRGATAPPRAARGGGAAPAPGSALLLRLAAALNGTADGADGHADLGPVPPLLPDAEDAAADAAAKRGLSTAGPHPVIARALRQARPSRKRS